MSREEKRTMPLEGLKVVELATVVATPITARMLSDYGAQVIKVESPSGDLLRPYGTWHEMPVKENNNPLFDLCNAGKQMVMLDLKTKEGMTALNRLLEEADVFLTNVRMQSLQRLSIDPESLEKRFPRLIYGHFSGFGLLGDECNKPGYDSTAFWLRSGASMDITTPGSFPIRASFGFGDIVTAGSFLSAILMALIGREKTGKGTLVTTSLLQSGIWCNAVSVMNAQPQYGKTYPVDRYLPGHPLADYYQCKDGEYIGIMQNSYEKDREHYATLFDLTELLEDPDYETLQTMRDAGKTSEITHHMQKIMLEKTSSEWDEILNKEDIPHELARHFRNVWMDPQAKAMDAFDEVSYPDGSVTAIPRPPFELHAYTRRTFEKAGALGQDTQEVCK